MLASEYDILSPVVSQMILVSNELQFWPYVCY